MKDEEGITGQESITEQIKSDDIRFVEMQFTDIFGVLKSITIPSECFDEALKKGLWFDGSSIRGFARIKESDMHLKPDINTYAVLPWYEGDKKTARFLCEVYTPDGKLFEEEPRYILKKIIKEAEDEGYIFMVGPEVEFYFFKSEDSKLMTIPHDSGGYFDSSTKDFASEVRKEIMIALKCFGLEPERSHHEVGPGQHEIGFRYGDALTTADRVITLKHVIKSVAHKYGIGATFMPKPVYGLSGSGMHIHFSLFKDGKNIFFDEEDKYHLSKIAKHFIGGIMHYAKEMAALLAPTVSSYKRLVSGYEAPVYICWSDMNRSALIRIPRISEGRKNSARAEIRCPDPSCSPYLAFAVLLKAGLQGIKEQIDPSEPIDDSVYEMDYETRQRLGIEALPESLGQALHFFRKSELVKELLGEKLYSKYLDAKLKEWEEFRITVTDWEVKRYLESC